MDCLKQVTNRLNFYKHFQKDKLVIGINNNNNNNNNKEKKDVSQHEALPLSHTNVPKTQPIIKFVNYILASNP